MITDKMKNKVYYVIKRMDERELKEVLFKIKLKINMLQREKLKNNKGGSGE